MSRVAVDPGVLISAFISPRRSAPALILDALLTGRIEAVGCPALIAELTEVLRRRKFARHADAGRADAYIDALRDCLEMVADPPIGPQRTADPDDEYLLALAEAHGLDAVVSGDKHLLDAAGRPALVLTPRQAVERFGLRGADAGPLAGVRAKRP